MIERWLRAIRDHPARPSAQQCHVLTMLALRLDDRTGRGFASLRTVAEDADASKSTVIRATGWARSEPVGLLLRTRRGHRVSAEVQIASEWQLTVPAQSVSGDTLGPTQSVNGADPKCQERRPKVSPGDRIKSPLHRESSPRGARALLLAQHAPRCGATLTRRPGTVSAAALAMAGTAPPAGANAAVTGRSDERHRPRRG
jgi:hypothetical protein